MKHSHTVSNFIGWKLEFSSRYNVITCHFLLFTARVSGNDNAGNTANASEYEEVSAQSSEVYETAICSNDTHVYEGLRE